MPLSSDFEEQYLALRTVNLPGWGGNNYSRRVQGWMDILALIDKAGLLPEHGSLTLELGSGNGMVTQLLTERGYDVEGIEISETAVSWAIEHVTGKARFYVGNATDLGRWPRSSKDLVVDANCLHCILGEDRSLCLAEVHRILHPEGKFLVSSMAGPPGEQLPPGMRCQEGNLFLGDQPVRTIKQPEELESELFCSGFQVIFRHLSNNPWWSHMTLLLRKRK